MQNRRSAALILNDCVCFKRTWLSAGVLEELYAGAGNENARKVIEKLGNDFTKVNRLLLPLQSDWINTGKILNRIGQKYGP